MHKDIYNIVLKALDTKDNAALEDIINTHQEYAQEIYAMKRSLHKGEELVELISAGVGESVSELVITAAEKGFKIISAGFDAAFAPMHPVRDEADNNKKDNPRQIDVPFGSLIVEQNEVICCISIPYKKLILRLNGDILREATGGAVTRCRLLKGRNEIILDEQSFTVVVKGD
jgi:hypothetical protein